MPVPKPAGPSGLGSFLKKNAQFAYGGGIGLAFLASDAKGILDADNKLKALLKTAKDFILIRVAMIGLFKGVSDVIKGLVRDTGSLDQALKRLTQIQQYARSFQAFAGGLDAAKQRIVELYKLSLRRPFKFEDIVEANKSLQVFTRGAYSSVEATKTVGDAALATGNSVSDTARAVGNFYDTLRSGQPIGAAADQLRQMGLISSSTSDELDGMSKSGQSMTSTFGALDDALKKTGEGAKGYKDEIQGITEEHEKAVEEFKTAFGKPWAGADAQATKNMAEGFKALTPTIGKLSESFAFLYNGASTINSVLFRFAAQSKVVQQTMIFLGKSIMGVTVAAGLFGISAIVPLIGILLRFSAVAGQTLFVAISRLTGNLGAAAVAGKALQTVMATFTVGSVILMAAGFVAALAGAIVKAREEAKQADKDFKSWKEALQESTSAILEQAAAVTDLASKYESLGKTLSRMTDLQRELFDLQDRHKHIVADLKALQAGPSEGIKIPHPFEEKRLEKEKQINEAKQRQIKINQDILKQSYEDQAAKQPLHNQLMKQEAERRLAVEQHSKGAAQRDSEQKRGADIAAKAEDDRSKIAAERMEKEKKLQEDQLRFAGRKQDPDKVEKRYQKDLVAQEEIIGLKKQEQDIGLAAPEFSATYKKAKADQLQQAKLAVEAQVELNTKKKITPEEKHMIEARLKSATALAGGEEGVERYKAHPEALTEAQIQAEQATAKEAQVVSPEELRQARVQEFQVGTEIKEHEARRRGDIPGAQKEEDRGALVKNFEQLVPLLGEQKAASVALSKTQDEISQQYADAPKVVSSMTAVGGGGGVSGVDPQIESAKRREQLQQQMVELLTVLTGQEPNQPNQPPAFQP